MPDRRTFLKTLSAGALGAAGLACDARGATTRAAGTLDRIGVQLYTVRQAMGDDFEGTLRRVAAIGYAEVEFAGYFGRPPAAVRAVLDDVGLRAPSAHVSYEVLGDDWGPILETANVVGHDYLICPGLPRSVTESIAGYQRVADVFNRAGERAREAGISFGYHNHAAEFALLEGQVPYDVLIAESDSQHVLLQMDLFWIIRGGRDPLEYFARYPGRFPSVHVKDMDGLPDGAMVDVGQGSIDFAAIFAERESAGIRHFFVEHDRPAEQFESIRVSYEYLEGLRF